MRVNGLLHLYLEEVCSWRNFNSKDPEKKSFSYASTARKNIIPLVINIPESGESKEAERIFKSFFFKGFLWLVLNSDLISSFLVAQEMPSALQSTRPTALTGSAALETCHLGASSTCPHLKPLQSSTRSVWLLSA